MSFTVQMFLSLVKAVAHIHCIYQVSLIHKPVKLNPPKQLHPSNCTETAVDIQSIIRCF